MEIHILGPLEAVDDDGVTLDLGSPREQVLLALLVLHADELLTIDRIEDALWPDGRPSTATKVVQVYVSHIRRSLGEAREMLQTQGHGYVLRAGADVTDVGRCERLVALAAAEADPVGRGRLLREALDLWRGRPLAGLEYHDFVTHEIARLEEWRAGIVEERIAADLEAGAGASLVPELGRLVRDYPLRERLRGLHMLALYRAGRQADALASYRDVRRLLDEDLGLEPGVALRSLERAILAHDETLLAPASAVASAGTSARRVIVVGSLAGAVGPALDTARMLAGARRDRELIVTRIVPADGLRDATLDLAKTRATLEEEAIACRVAAFTSVAPGADLARLAVGEPADLMLVDVGLDVLGDGVRALLEAAPCDVALARGAARGDGPVMVPFGAATHDWAALELGAWLAQARGTTLQLVGGATDDPAGRDASRLLAHASLAIQQATGVVAEPLLATPGAGVEKAARAAGAVVVGLADSWRETGLGPVRSSLVDDPSALVLLVHRGIRPGGVTPASDLTGFAWSVERSRFGDSARRP